MAKTVNINGVKIGRGNKLVLIAGPCVIEDEKSALEHAAYIKKISAKLSMPFIYKSSFYKANRTSAGSYKGPGIEEGLLVLKKVKDKLGIPVLSDIHCRLDAEEAGKVLDIIQIPAFLSRQTDLIEAAAKTGKAVSIKKAQFMSPYEMAKAAEKAVKAGNSNVLLTERGTCFGYNNLVSDMRSLKIMRDMGYPVIYDASHSVQLPAGEKDASGGDRQFIPVLSRAAVAAGCDGIFIEVHKTPDKAPCDGPNMWPLDKLEALLIQLQRIHEAADGQ
ncbi:MAG: 3-deoxy-8-phosphooctulonate synthase [Candidatus Omnitrophica bacterium CG1_02_49_10]|nr:MAG: 3-deoxy-8-phosphooctulonate synthase [Candidatus Omnitrophica bacterium CG1_02_49_10]